MKLFHQSLSVLSAITIALSIPLSMAESPEDAYLHANMLISKAKNQESGKFYKSASSTIQEAQSALSALQKLNPEWHPEWIEGKMAAIREASDRLAPLVVEFPNSVEPSVSENEKGHSVPPSAEKKTSPIDEALKPSISLSTGVAAPVEVMKGSVHERYLKQDARYLAHVEQMKAEAAQRKKDALAQEKALKEQERINRSQLDKLIQRQQQEERNLRNLESNQIAASAASASVPVNVEEAQSRIEERQRALVTKQAELEQQQKKLQLDAEKKAKEAQLLAQRQEVERMRSQIAQEQAKIRQEELRKEQDLRIRAQKEELEKMKLKVRQEQDRMRQEQARIQQEQAEAMRKRVEADKARREAEQEAARKRIAPPRNTPRENSGRSRFRIG